MYWDSGVYLLLAPLLCGWAKFAHLFHSIKACLKIIQLNKTVIPVNIRITPIYGTKYTQIIIKTTIDKIMICIECKKIIYSHL